MVLFTDQVELFIPPKKGKSHILRIIRELLEFSPQGSGTDVSNALKYVTNVMKKKAIVFVLSDFMAGDYKDTLRIVSGKHDVTGIRVYDPKEETDSKSWDGTNARSRNWRFGFSEYGQQKSTP